MELDVLIAGCFVTISFSHFDGDTFGMYVIHLNYYNELVSKGVA